MARWDKFIEGLSSGYGTGYARGQQYQADQRRRDIDAANKELGGILGEETTTEAAIPVEQVTIPETKFTDRGMDTAGRRQYDIDVGDIATTQEQPIQLRGQITGPQTRSQMQRMKEALTKKYQLEGNTEGLMNLDAQMNTFRQTRILENLNQAASLIEHDPEAAAQYLHNAYGYYPDGRQAMFTMKNGELYGYGFDEDTNKFSKKMKIDADSIAAIAEQLKDPQAFKQRVAAENLAAEQTAYQRWQDAIKNSLEQRKVAATEAGVRIDASRAEYQNLGDWAKAVKDYFGVDTSSLAATGKGITNLKKYQDSLNDAINYFDTSIEKGMLTPAELTLIGADEGQLGTGYRQVQGAMADILFNNMQYSDDARVFSKADVLRAAMDARMMDMFQGRMLAGQDAGGDEQMQEVFEDLMQRQEGAVALGPRGTLEFTIDGQTVHLTPQKYPNLARAAAIQAGVDPAQLGLPPAPSPASTPQRAAVPAEEPPIQYGAPPPDRVEPGELYDLAVGAATEGMLGIRENDAKAMIRDIAQSLEAGQPPSQVQLRRLKDNYGPAELRALGAPEALISALYPNKPTSAVIQGF